MGATSLALAIVAMIAIVAVRYLLVSGFFAWLSRKARPGIYKGLDDQIRFEIGWSLASAAVYAVPAAVVIWGWQEQGWTRIYEDIADYPIWWMPLSLFVYLLVHDSWFYWTHRLMHHRRLFGLMHQVHHRSRPPTAWAAMSFHWTEAISGAVLVPMLVFFIPIHWTMLATMLSIMTLFGVTNHMGWEIFPKRLVNGPIGEWFITATHHQRHHERYQCNFGLYFRHWDRLCGTDMGLGQFGTTDRGKPQ